MKFITAFIIALLALPLQNAHAKNVILTGTIEAQYLCHDGGNRGATVKLFLSRSDEVDIENDILVDEFARTSGKHYYAGTSCMDLGLHVFDNEMVYVFYGYEINFGAYDTGYYCEDFNIRYVRNGKKVWVQNGGTTIWNITCVAKDGI